MFWRRKPPPFDRPTAPTAVTLHALGYVRNSVAKPRPRGWDDIVSDLEFAPEHLGRLEGIEAYSHVIVVCYLDLASDAPETPEVLTLASGNTYGILATRSQLRPNHLGVTAVPLVARDSSRLRVRGLDAIDGTPIVDIKPYLPVYDAHPGATVPRES